MSIHPSVSCFCQRPSISVTFQDAFTKLTYSIYAHKTLSAIDVCPILWKQNCCHGRFTTLSLYFSSSSFSCSILTRFLNFFLQKLSILRGCLLKVFCTVFKLLCQCRNIVKNLQYAKTVFVPNRDAVSTHTHTFIKVLLSCFLFVVEVYNMQPTYKKS